MNLYQKQIQLETEMAEAGRTRFLKSLRESQSKGTLNNTPIGEKITKHFFYPVYDKVVEDTNQGGVRFKHFTAINHLRNLPKGGIEKCIAIAFKQILDNVCKNRSTLQAVFGGIGQAIEDEQRYTDFKAENEEAFRQIEKHTSVYKELYKKHRVLRYANENHKLNWQTWPITLRTGLGAYLVEVITQQTGLLTICEIPERRGRRISKRKHISLSPEAASWIEQEIQTLSYLFPSLEPMIVPPIPWEDLFVGGYISPFNGNLTFVKNHNRKYLEDLDKVKMPVVFNAVNAIQATPWKIHKGVLEVVETLWKSNASLDIIDFPDREDLEIPPFPYEGDKGPFTEEQNVIIKEWKNFKFKTTKLNMQYRSKRLRITRMLQLAQKYNEYEEIYFPYNCDFRGRVYPMCTYLNPQGDALAKGLLQFAKGKPVDSREAVDWLCIHGANCYGFDKVPFQDRIDWVEDHHDELIHSAENPYDTTFWMEADSPFQFLAFCFEWKKFYEEGLGYISYIPINVDGSCNGLQHFSAMVRDSVAGKSVNLVPSEMPQDIYQDVADKVIKRLNESSDTLAKEWLKHGIDRKTTKTPVMVLPYGGTKFSIGVKLKEELNNTYVRMDDERNPFTVGTGIAGNYLAGYIWDAIENTVRAAPVTMKWLQEVARQCAKANVPVVWGTPSGFIARQDYPKHLAQQVKLNFLEKIVKPKFRTGHDVNQDTRRAAQGISPNFIHSMDAAALHLTVDILNRDYGIKDFMMVHDSYGVHACDVPKMSKVLREVFIDIYQSDQLQIFLTTATKYLPPEYKGKIPSPPEKGDLDITLVNQSDFFFS